jgi:hypothetical protein
MKKILIILPALLCCCFVSTGQQVVSTGGYSVKSDYSLNWILGGSLSNVFVQQVDADVIKHHQPSDEIITAKVYPVPAHEYVKIEISSADTGKIHLDLLNNQGIKVLSRTMPFQPVIELSLNDILPGTYFLKLTRSSNELQLIETKKIIKN